MANNNKHTGPNVPALRFPEFSGEWEKKCLGDISENISSGKTKSTTTGGKYVLIGSTGVIGNTSNADYSGNLILVARVGANAGLINYYSGDCGITDNTLIIKPLEQEKNFCHYVYHYLKHCNLNQFVFGSGQPLITGGMLKRLPIRYGTTDEINKLSSLFDLLDARIEAQSKIIEDKETLYKAISNILFSHYANSSPTYQLGDLANLYQPETIPSTKLSRSGRYLVYGANGIIGRYDKYNHEKSQICLTCRGNTCGKINFSQPYSWITGNAMVINIDNNTNNIDKRFLYHYMKNYNFTPFISGSGQPQIIRSTVEKLPVLNVNIQTQKKIASILDSIVISIDIARKKVDMDQNVKKYLLENLFI